MNILLNFYKMKNNSKIKKFTNTLINHQVKMRMIISNKTLFQNRI